MLRIERDWTFEIRSVGRCMHTGQSCSGDRGVCAGEGSSFSLGAGGQ